jgi:hypothetical protein
MPNLLACREIFLRLQPHFRISLRVSRAPALACSVVPLSSSLAFSVIDSGSNVFKTFTPNLGNFNPGYCILACSVALDSLNATSPLYFQNFDPSWISPSSRGYLNESSRLNRAASQNTKSKVSNKGKFGKKLLIATTLWFWHSVCQDLYSMARWRIELRIFLSAKKGKWLKMASCRSVRGGVYRSWVGGSGFVEHRCISTGTRCFVRSIFFVQCR